MAVPTSQHIIFTTAFDVNYLPQQTSGGINIINGKGSGSTRLTINENVRDYAPMISPSGNP